MTASATCMDSFKIIKEAAIEEVQSQGKLLQHTSGAQVLLLKNEDENKAFGVTFLTPAKDSTGLPHILEHSVLCGSEAYPIKKPFVEMLKASLNTFLNAMTYQDRTVYPVASTNEQDFFNLMSVYLDSVFFPTLTEETFLQEGWHYSISEEGKLGRSGVVYNEMKGVYSDPLSRVYRSSVRSLFPDTDYQYDSGGDPAAIPSLTYEAFCDYHKQYYTPGNALIVVYGDADESKELELLDKWLSRFTPSDPCPVSELQPLKPLATEVEVPVDAGEEGEDALIMVQCNWLLPEITDAKEQVVLSILDYLVAGTSAAPLHKKLIDSGLGEAVLGGGFGFHLRQPFFTLGLKGVAAENVAKVRPLILEGLQELVAEGIPALMQEAAINAIEFSLRENNTGGYPRGIVAMLRALGGWVFGEDPFDMLRWENELSEVKKDLAEGKPLFTEALSRYLLDNEHWTEVRSAPEVGFNARLEEQEIASLAEIRASLSDEQVEDIRKAERRLEEAQQKPDSAEDLNKIPVLGIGDLDKEIKVIPQRVVRTEGVVRYEHDLPTNKIAYVGIALPLRQVKAAHVPLLPLYCASFLEMGTESSDFVTLSQLIDKDTGGIGVSPWTALPEGSKESLAYLMCGGKATVDKVPKMVELMREVLTSCRWDNQERFLQLVKQRRAGLEAALVPSGSRFAVSQLGAMSHQSGWFGEQTGGVSQIEYLRELEDEATSNWPKVEEALRSLHKATVCRGDALVKITVDKEFTAEVAEELEGLIGSLPEAPAVAECDWPLHLEPRNIGLALPAQVNYVAKVLDLYKVGFESKGSMGVITNLINSVYLWDRVRMAGGAYGASGGFNRMSGLFTFSSYRDPNLDGTLKVFDELGEWLSTASFSEQEIERAIIGTIGSVDSYQLPDAQGSTAFARALLSITDEERQKRRSEIFATSEDDFRALGAALKKASASGLVAVVGAEEAIRAADSDFAEIKVVQ